MPDKKFDKSEQPGQELLRDIIKRIDVLERHMNNRFLRTDKEINALVDAILHLRDVKDTAKK